MAKFELGQVIVTASIDARMKSDAEFDKFVKVSLGRFKKGDWGVLCDEDKAEANKAATNGQMVMGAYARNGEEIWIITEWDRSATTILFPHER